MTHQEDTICLFLANSVSFQRHNSHLPATSHQTSHGLGWISDTDARREFEMRVRACTSMYSRDGRRVYRITSAEQTAYDGVRTSVR